MGNQVVLGLVGSPNKQDALWSWVSAALEGASHAGGSHRISANVGLCWLNALQGLSCHGFATQNKKCTYEDKNFELLSRDARLRKHWS